MVPTKMDVSMFQRLIISASRMILSGLIFIALGAPLAAAQTSQGIAATVNDDVISTYDVEQRINLIIFSAGVQPTPETIGRLREQVLRQLIDEQLQLQEALRFEVEVSAEDIGEMLDNIGSRSDMDGEALLTLLTENNVNPSTLLSQVRADIAWQRLVGGLYRNQVNISEEEIDIVLDRMQRNINQPQYEVSEIFLSVDNPEQEAAIGEAAERMVLQLRRGANFGALARQFSQNPSAAQGGDLGWVQDGQLPPELNDMLARMSPGQFSLPVRSTGGFYILALRDKRITGAADPSLITVTLRQVVIPARQGMTEDDIRQMGDTALRVSETVQSCEQMRDIALSSPFIVGGDIGTRRMTDLRDHFMQAVRGVPEGSATAPIPSEIGFHVLFVCDRTGDEVNLPSRDDIEDQLFDQQITMVARRHLRDLRRDALIEVRDGYGG